MTSVAEASTLADELLGSVEKYTSMADHVTGIDRKVVLGLERNTATNKQNGNGKKLADIIVEHDALRKLSDAANQLADARVKKSCEGHVRKLDSLPDLF